MRKYLCTPIVIHVNTIPNHSKPTVILPMHEGFVGYIDPNVLKQKYPKILMPYTCIDN